METTVNTFSGGLNKDTSKDKYQNVNYFNLENGRILTDEGLSTLSIGNVRGNIELSPLATLTTQELVGWCTLQDDYVLFYRDIATPAIGYIYRLTQTDEDKFDLITNGVDDWIYTNSQFNFGDIVYAIGRYENDLVQKVYWIDVAITDATSTTYTYYDHKNMFRMINLASTTLGTTPLDKINIVQDVDFSTSPVVFTGFTEGSLNAGMIGYAYRYYNLYGSETRFSPVCELIPISNSKEIVGTRLYKGSLAGTLTGKGILGSISNIDTTFDRIEIISLHYSSYNGTPNIRIVSQQPTTSSTIYFTDDGTNYFGSLTLDEYTLSKNPIYAKAMVVKDNRLFIGNIKEDIYWNQALIDWDSRAYRFISAAHPDPLYARHAMLYTGGMSGILETDLDGTLVPIHYSSIDPLADCVNQFNIISNDGNANLTCKYQSDGVTLGGSGINISYSFNTSNTYVLDDRLDATLSDQLSFYTQITNVDKQLQIRRGFQHDEVYRFGIVFYDKYSRSSLVKWIGDIRIPNYDEHNYLSTSGTIVSAVPITIDFTVSNTPTDAVGYQIVYVPRGINDRTVSSVGIAHGVEDSYTIDGNFCSITRLDNGGTTTHNSITGIRNGTLNWLRKYDIVDFTSPEILYGITHDDNTYLDLVGSFAPTDVRYRPRSTSNDYSVHYDYASNFSLNRADISELRIFHPGQIGTVNGKPWTHRTDNDGGYTYYSSRGTSAVIGLTSVYTIVNNLGSYGLFMLRRNVVGYGGNSFNDRFNNTYVSASPVTSTGTTPIRAVYGDTFISIFEFLRGVYDPLTANDIAVEYQDWYYVPLESSINLLFNEGYHASKAMYTSNPTPPVDIFTLYEFTDYHWINEDRLYVYNNVYSMNPISNQYFVATLDQSNIITTPTEVRYSNFKYDGETTDSWLKYGVNNSNSCIGNYGEITALTEQTNYIYCFQEHGIALVMSNTQELTTATTGTPIILGRGGVLDRFQYYSTEVGCQWGFEVTTSQNNIYWIDGSHKKMYRITDKGIETLSDLKLCSTLFSNAVDKYTRTWGQYDPSLKSLYVTVWNKYPNDVAVPTYLGTTVNGTKKYYLSFNTGTLTNRATYKYTKLLVGNVYDLVVSNNTIPTGRFKVLEVDGANSYYIVVEDIDDIITTPITTQLFDMSYYVEYRNNFTFTFNEFIDNYEAMHSFIPDWYLQNSRSFLTYYFTTGSLYQHNIGIYGQYYNLPLNKLRIDLISNAQGQGIKEWNNINWFSECTKESQDVPDVTISKIQCEDDYQQTDVVILYPCVTDWMIPWNEAIVIPPAIQASEGYYNLRRVKRQFNTAVPRDEDNNELLSRYTPRTYRKGDAMEYFNKRYVSKVNVTTFTVGKQYLPGEIVILAGQIYKKLTTVNNTPPSTAWSNITSSFVPPLGTTDDTPYWTYDPIYNRLRDYYLRTILQYPNYDDRRFILHDIRTSYEVL